VSLTVLKFVSLQVTFPFKYKFAVSLQKAGAFTNHRLRPLENLRPADKSNNDYLKNENNIDYSLMFTVPAC
jgi:hypothetical protein